MTKYRRSWGTVMSALIRHQGLGKNQDFFITHGGDADAVLEEEINAMDNIELIELMESAGIIQTPREDQLGARL
jgi:hypothetical protein